MKSFYHLIGLIICILSFTRVQSQELTFDSNTFNFGEIPEDGGVVTTTFTACNNSENPIVIISASSSCGCTVPKYSRQPIMAGQSSSIEVSFDPMDRPGKFNKTIQLITAPENQRYTLTITGNVTPRQKSIEELYPFDMGDGLRFAANYYPLSYVEQQSSSHTQVGYINTSSRAVQLSLEAKSRSGLIEISEPKNIPAGQRSSFTAGYNLALSPGHYGPLSDRFSVKVNGKESKYNLIFNGHAIDHFTEDKRSSPPICNVNVRTVRLGEIQKGKVSSRAGFIIENSGISDLIIRDVDLAEGLHCSIQSGVSIAPGEQMTVEMWINSRGMDYGHISKYLILTVNDPDAPLVRIRATVEIISK